jgi:hypothetical protein
MTDLKASHITFEKRYDDASSVEYAVRYWERRDEMEFCVMGKSCVTFPVEQLEWIMDCLRRIREELPKTKYP